MTLKSNAFQFKLFKNPPEIIIMKQLLFASLIIITVILSLGCTKEIVIPQKTCCEYAREVIPEKITLTRYFEHPTEKVIVWTYYGNEKRGIDDNYSLSWKDGTKFDIKSICFMQGVKKNQNVNIFYETPCTVGGTTHGLITYRKKAVDSNGVIIGTNLFTFNTDSIRLIPINGSEKMIKLYNRSNEMFDAKEFILSDYKFSDCYWINGSGSVSTFSNCSAIDGYTNVTSN
jgi:hypothetical protein